MKLYLSSTSPYARLVAAAIIEKGLSDRVERVLVDPWASGEEILRVNPASRVPALEVEEGAVITESLLIVTYLEGVAPTPALIPAAGAARVLRKVGLGHGLVDSAVGIVATRKFHPEFAPGPLHARRIEAIRRSLSVLDQTLRPVSDRPDLGDLAAAVALGYLDLRFSTELPWRADYPALERWYAEIAQRPSLRETRPPAQ